MPGPLPLAAAGPFVAAAPLAAAESLEAAGPWDATAVGGVALYLLLFALSLWGIWVLVRGGPGTEMPGAVEAPGPTAAPSAPPGEPNP